jgi:PLP dependent protein
MTAGRPGPGGHSDRESQLTHALAAVRTRLAIAAESVGRNVSEIELLPITKFFPATDVAILSRLGVRAVGESRDQEASAKVTELKRLSAGPSRAGVCVDSPVLRWHMVGQIQRKKARSVARWAHTAHSIDNSALVGALDRAVATALDEGRREARLRVYVQLSLDGDATRGGVDRTAPGALDGLCDEIARAQSLELVGLMGIPPLEWDADQAFEQLKSEHDRVLRAHPEAAGLSAGMSGDLEAAVKHGSTCVRVGTALLGQRPLRSP